MLSIAARSETHARDISLTVSGEEKKTKTEMLENRVLELLRGGICDLVHV